MSRAIIMEGVWTRNVPWSKGGVWRTDMFKSVLEDQRLSLARFNLAGGPSILIPAADLKRVLIGGCDHYGGKIWGPFNIDPEHGTIDGRKVKMQIGA